MIYLFERIPINQTKKGSLIGMFSKLALNIQTLEKLEEIELLKDQYYTFFLNILSDKNYIPKLEELKNQKKYL